MNTNNVKQYAPKARKQFIKAVTERLAHLGISETGVTATEVKGDSFYIDGVIYRGEYADDLKTLLPKRDEIISNCLENGSFSSSRYQQYVEQVAYTWFNRFCALRYMELHGYLVTPYRLLSNPDSTSSHLIEALIPGNILAVAEALGISNIRRIQQLMLDNELELLYRELILAVCNQLHYAMPFMFSPITAEESLLLPAHLTSTQSILRDLVSDIPEEDWQNIEIIGWLYQYYISEHKAAVIGKTVKSEDIPAATQLFTPNWIVKYLVQNSVGHYWLQTNPHSALQKKMEYYIAPADQEASVIAELEKITPDYIDPETITVLDPACGSGHILLEAYNVLKEIYRESGYLPNQIPRLILEKNLYGLDIDDRAAQLASFAVMMIAVKDDPSLLESPVVLNILSFQESREIDIDHIWQNLVLEDPDNIYQPLLRRLLHQFEDAKTFGSLIKIEADQQEVIVELFIKVKAIAQSGDTFREENAKLILPFLQQALFLAKRYDAVVANPPYMGNKYLAPKLKAFLKEFYNKYEKDLFSAFIIGNLNLTRLGGQLGFMTPFVWMFISSYENLRTYLIENETITSLIQLEYSGFDGATVPICTFTLRKGHIDEFTGCYIRLSEFKGAENQAPKTLEAIQNRQCGWFYESKADDFKQNPRMPIAYWLPESFFKIMGDNPVAGDYFTGSTGLQTSDSKKFLRYWWEVDISKKRKWHTLAKGGAFRKWFGNLDYVVNWEDEGQEIKESVVKKYPYLKGNYSLVVKNENNYYSQGFLTSRVTSGRLGFRIKNDEIYSDACTAGFPDKNLYHFMGILNTGLIEIVKSLQPTLNFQAGDLESIPIVKTLLSDAQLESNVRQLILITENDWHDLESSSGFKKMPLDFAGEKLCSCYSALRLRQLDAIQRVYSLEVENNRLFIEAYGLKDELSPEVPLEEITLTCNPHYRYRGDLTDKEREERYQSDTITELLSYIIGCAMGRYSLDREGLVYAQAGNEGFQELVDEGAYTTFPADKDGIIPLTSREEGWFNNDATQRVIDFVKQVWGEAHLEENLQFIANSLNLYALKPRKGETSLQTIERYFTTQFYKDHCSMYQKTPIYWLVSSGKEKAFESLFYLHRYNPSTFSKMRMDYVVPLLGKFNHRLESLRQSVESATSTAEKRRLDTEIKSLEKRHLELVKFDENIRSMADAQIALDLDDGVKVNYEKFGTILAKI